MMEFRGWRRYSMHTLIGGRLSLHGVYEEWKSAVKTAVCHNGDITECPMETTEEHRERLGPNADPWPVGGSRWHGCGIHSFKTLAAMLTEEGRRELYDGMNVYAEVVNYGRVDEFENGYRAEHTRILKMYLIAEKDSQADYLEALRRILETRFGVSTMVVSMDDLIAEHAPGWEPKVHDFTNNTTAVPAWVLQRLSSRLVVQNGMFSWQTSASASSGTTTSPNRSQRRSGSHSQSKNQSPSTDKDWGGVVVTDDTQDAAAYAGGTATIPTKKKPVEAKLPGNQKKWWLNR